LHVRHVGGDRFLVSGASDDALEIELLAVNDEEVLYEAGGIRRRAHHARDDRSLYIELSGVTAILREPPVERAARGAAAAESHALAPISGRVIRVEVADDQQVKPGEALVVLEAMKMEHQVLAASPGRVARVLVAVGEQVSARQPLVMLDVHEG
jgi:acetyl/propionyl-CoA carboxylase alpha subunit